MGHRPSAAVGQKNIKTIYLYQTLRVMCRERVDVKFVENTKHYPVVKHARKYYPWRQEQQIYEICLSKSKDTLD